MPELRIVLKLSVGFAEIFPEDGLQLSISLPSWTPSLHSGSDLKSTPSLVSISDPALRLRSVSEHTLGAGLIWDGAHRKGLREWMLRQDLGAGSAPRPLQRLPWEWQMEHRAPGMRWIPNVQVGTTPTLVPWLLGKNCSSGKAEDNFFRLVKLT